MTDPATSPTADPLPPVVARAGRYYRNARYLMTLGVLIMGAFFMYDGYVRYPAKNVKIAEVDKQINAVPKGSPTWIELDQKQKDLGTTISDTDIRLQKRLGYALPLVALAYLVFFLHKSRGEVRLENNTLHAPGHPPVPLTAIQSVDSGLWKKKGIAKVAYDVAGQKGVVTLDDFVYQQTPIDAIYDRLIARDDTAAPVPSPGTLGEAESQRRVTHAD